MRRRRGPRLRHGPEEPPRAEHRRDQQQLGMPVRGFSQSALLDAIDRAGDAGILFVAAAGNDGADSRRRQRCDALLPGQLLLHDAGRLGAGTASSRSPTSPPGAGCPAFSNYGATSVDLGCSRQRSSGARIPGRYAADVGDQHGDAPRHRCRRAVCEPRPESEPRQRCAVDCSRRRPPSRPRLCAGRTVTGDRLDIGALVQTVRCQRARTVWPASPAAAAAASSAAAGLARAPVDRRPTAPRVPAGLVIRQEPAAGTLVVPGARRQPTS